MNSTFITRGASLARDVSIESFITEDEYKKLLSKWAEGMSRFEFESPLEFGNTTPVLTCKMVDEAGFENLAKLYGKKFAARVHEIAKTNRVV